MKNSLCFAFAVMLAWAACTSKGKVAKTTSTEPTDAQLTAAKTKFPSVTMDELKKGHSIYYGACTNCHGAKDIKSRSEEQWSGILDQMAPKANLTAQEKDAVWKYVTAVKLSAEKGS